MEYLKVIKIDQVYGFIMKPWPLMVRKNSNIGSDP